MYGFVKRQRALFAIRVPTLCYLILMLLSSVDFRMEFMLGLPRTQKSNESVMVVVDRSILKDGSLYTLKKTMDASNVVYLFFK